MKEIQKHKKILLIVSVLMVLLLLICVWWLDGDDVKEGENKVSGDEIFIEQEKEAEGGLKDEKFEEAEKEEAEIEEPEKATPFIDSTGNSMNDKDVKKDESTDSTEGNTDVDSEQKDKDKNNENDKDVENDGSTDNTEKDADVGLEQDATEQTNKKYGDFF